MKELLRRLRLKPLLAVEILGCCLFINILSLASTIYVILVLSRYVGYGFDGTLVTLTVGVLIATILSFGFTAVRSTLASAVSVAPDFELSNSLLAALAQAKAQALDRIPQARVHEILAGVQTVAAAYEGAHVINVLEAPFFLLFIIATFLLSPALALVTLLAIAATLVNGWLSTRMGKVPAARLQEEMVAHRTLVASAVGGADTVRAFLCRPFLTRQWNGQLSTIGRLSRSMSGSRTFTVGVSATIAGLLRVGVYAVGAKLAVDGVITTSTLIGVSILASKALQIVTSFMQSSFVIARAGEKMAQVRDFLSLPRESSSGTAMHQYTGRMEFKDLAFAHPGSTGPLFEGLNLVLDPGSVLVVRGFNGSGKTTLARMVAGLLEPSRGQVLAEGVDLRQIALEWWRGQIIYVPQEALFLSTTIRENLLFANPELPGERLNEILRMADLRRFLDGSPQGLEAPVREGGRNLPLGIRRRLALARGLVSDGPLAILDDPTEGLDQDGTAAMYNAINDLARRGKTILVFTNDTNILKASRLILDLSEKPVPVVVRAPAPEGGPQ
jgi:ATP-binding cassette subfamily C protein LapB